MNLDAYLLSVIGTILLGALLTAILPEGKTSGIVHNMTRLVCLLVIISPVLTFFNGEKVKSEKNIEKSVIQTDELFIEYYSEMRVRNAEIALANELADTFNEPCKVCMRWALEKDEIRIQEIVLTLERECDEEVKARMCEYVTKNYCSEVLIE